MDTYECGHTATKNRLPLRLCVHVAWKHRSLSRSTNGWKLVTWSELLGNIPACLLGPLILVAFWAGLLRWLDQSSMFQTSCAVLKGHSPWRSKIILLLLFRSHRMISLDTVFFEIEKVPPLAQSHASISGLLQFVPVEIGICLPKQCSTDDAASFMWGLDDGKHAAKDLLSSLGLLV